MSSQRELEWHNDGHRVIVLIDRSNVVVNLEYCPNGGKPNTACWHKEVDGCLVKYFVQMYGLEINEGMAPASLFRDISWTFIEGYDLYTSQAFIIPNEDELFSEWVESQMKEYNDTETEE